MSHLVNETYFSLSEISSNFTCHIFFVKKNMQESYNVSSTVEYEFAPVPTVCPHCHESVTTCLDSKFNEEGRMSCIVCCLCCFYMSWIWCLACFSDGFRYQINSLCLLLVYLPDISFFHHMNFLTGHSFIVAPSVTKSLPISNLVTRVKW